VEAASAEDDMKAARAELLGILESDGTPEHVREETQEYIREGTQELGDKESSKACISTQKS
jgi:hypothetical protein